LSAHRLNHEIEQHSKEAGMTGNKTLVVAAITTALGILGAATAAASDHNGAREPERGYVVPCSLAGVNPAYHPDIFGNPAAAKAYGFVQGPGRVWRVEGNCRR
jgi:hypothetical protein